jgi:hypothetical protein
LKLKKKKNQEIAKESIEVETEIHEIHEVHKDESDDILEQIKALGTGNLGSGLADMNFQGSIIHIEEAKHSQSSFHSTLERSGTRRSQVPKISIDRPPSEARNSFANESFEYAEPVPAQVNTLRRKKEKRESMEPIKPLIDLTPTSVITKGALLDTYDKKNKPPLDPKSTLSRSKSKRSTAGEETLLRVKSIKNDELGHSTSLRRKKSVKQIDDEVRSTKSVSRRREGEEMSRSRSRRPDEDSSSNNDDNVPLGATLSRSKSKKDGLVRSRSRKDSKAKLIGTDEDISDRPPDYDIEPVRSSRQQSNGSGMLEYRRSRTDLGRSKSQRSSRHRSRSRKREESDDDDETPLANVALQALQQNLASNKSSRIR